MKETPQIEPETPAAWRAWLQTHHASAPGVWLVMWKKAMGRINLTYDEAVEEALCFGWVDSRPGKLDDVRSRLYFAPRKAGSGWARPNKLRVEKLIADGRMQAAGMAKIEAARADGSWEKLDAVENLEVPADLAAAFERFPGSAAHFAAFPRSAKRGILEWIVQAKRPETRSARIEETASKAARNERANQWTPKT